MTIFESLLLGLIQGATEFLPVSSSGHLILLREWLGINTQSGLTYDAVLQLATILAVFIYFRNTVFILIGDLAKSILGKAKDIPADRKNLLLALIAGTIPALAVGVMLEDIMETTFRSSLLVAAMLILGSLLMFFAEKFSSFVIRHSSFNLHHGWWIGWFQALALIPGVSRSGATISGGLFLGLSREAATRFSFLLALPIITGSGLKKLFEVSSAAYADISFMNLAVSSVTAFAVGLGAIHFLLKYLKKHTLYAFVVYRLVLAAAIIISLQISIR